MTINDLSVRLQNKIGRVADKLAKETGFVQRQRKVSGSNFIQTLIFGWLIRPQASLTELLSSAHQRNLEISAQGLDKRFKEETVHFCQRLLEDMLLEVVVAKQGVKTELLEKFSQVRVIDTTVAALPEMFKVQWPGTSAGDGKSNKAALKVEASLELKQGTLQGTLLAGKTNDRKGALARADLPVGSLQIADLGYFSLQRMGQLDVSGVYWLSRLRQDTIVCDRQGRVWDLLEQLRQCDKTQQEFEVKLGHQHLNARLLAYRVPEEVAARRRDKLRRTYQKHSGTPTKRSLELCSWTLLITNAPADKLTMEEAAALYGSRWQIELTFKLWKQHMKIDQSVSKNPWRILCELYIKLMAALVQHWIVQSSSCWQQLNKSLVKAYKVISSHAACLSNAFDCLPTLTATLEKLDRSLFDICRQNSRKKKLNTWKKLAPNYRGAGLS